MLRYYNIKKKKKYDPQQITKLHPIQTPPKNLSIRLPPRYPNRPTLVVLIIL